MATIKSYTDLQQSKKLAEFLPLESADMFYCYGMNIDTKKCGYDTVPTIIDVDNQIDICDVPCWSLAALLSVLPFPVLYMEMLGGMILWCCEGHLMETDEVVKIEHYNNPVDACYELITKLYEEKLL